MLKMIFLNSKLAEKFKKRSEIHSVIRHGEVVSSNKEVAKKFVIEFSDLIRE